MSELTGLHVRGYKACNDIYLSDLKQVNYLVGENGSGKSSVFEALGLISAFIKRGNEGEVEAEYYGDLTRFVHANFMVELMFDDQMINTATGRPIDYMHFGAQAIDFIKHYESPNPTRGIGLQTMIWQSYILDANANGVEMASNFKERYIFDLDHIDGEPDSLKDFLNKHYVRPGEHVRNIFRSMTTSAAIELEITKEETKDKTERHETLKCFSFGYQQLIELYFGIKRMLKAYKEQAPAKKIIVCLEEPGLGLHPRLQKKIPELLEDLLQIDNFKDMTFLVTTHSPFIISAACELPSQKTYLIKDGTAVNKAGDREIPSKGYRTSDCLGVVASMLDAGFKDIAKQPTTKEQICLFYCEGEKKTVRDSDIYRIIFQDKPGYIFVSTGSFMGVVNAYYSARAAVKFVFGEQSTAIALVDRSNSYLEFPLDQSRRLPKTSNEKPIFSAAERKEFIESDLDKGYRMLKRKELENYLFDPSVIALLPKKEAELIWNDAALKTSGILAEDIDFTGGEVKDYLNKKANYRKMAHLIYESRSGATKKIYEELLDCLEEAR